MKFIEATDIEKDYENSESHHFAQAIIQKNTPGTYTYTFGTGNFDAEAVVNHLFAGVVDVIELTQRVDAWGLLLRSHDVNKSIFSALFPVVTTKLDSNTVTYGVPELMGILERVPKLQVDPGLVAATAEVVIEALAETRFISRSVGYSYRETRTDRTPSFMDLTVEFVRQEVINVLNGLDLRIRTQAGKYTPAHLESDYQRKMSDLGQNLQNVGYYQQSLNTALYAVLTYFTKRGSLTDYIPQEVMLSTEFRQLISNVTFVQAAFEAGIDQTVDGPWNMMKAVKETLRVLNLSGRYSVVSLAEVVAPYQYTPLEDGRKNLIGGVLSYSSAMRHSVEVGIFDEITSLSKATEPTRLPIYDNALGSTIAAIQGKDVTSFSHEVVKSILSTMYVDESDENSRSVLAIIDTLSEVDMFHLAAFHADLVLIPKDSDDLTGVVFMKRLNGKRLFADALPAEGTVYTSDPETLLLCCDEFSASGTFDLSTQITDPRMWQTMMIDQNDELLTSIGGARKIQLDVGGQPVKHECSLFSLLHLVQRDYAKMITQVKTADILEPALLAPLEAIDYLKANYPNEDAKETVLIPMKKRAAHALNDLLGVLYKSDAIKAISDHVINKMVRKVPARTKDITYQRLHQVTYRRHLDARLTFMVLSELGLLTPGLEGNVPHVEEKVIEFFTDLNFFESLIGTEMALLDGAKKERATQL